MKPVAEAGPLRMERSATNLVRIHFLQLAEVVIPASCAEI
jgi:hypothetical protein